jgi:hypothetical protein
VGASKVLKLVFFSCGPISLKKEMLWTLNATTTTRLFRNHIRLPNDPKWDSEGSYHGILRLVWVLGAQSKKLAKSNTNHKLWQYFTHHKSSSHSIGESRRFCWAIVRSDQNNHWSNDQLFGNNGILSWWVITNGWDAKIQAQNLPGLVTLRAWYTHTLFVCRSLYWCLPHLKSYASYFTGDNVQFWYPICTNWKRSRIALLLLKTQVVQ